MYQKLKVDLRHPALFTKQSICPNWPTVTFINRLRVETKKLETELRDTSS